MNLSDVVLEAAAETAAPDAAEAPPERPMSERRKRKLAEEQARLAAEAEALAAAPLADIVDPFDTPASPPAAYDPPPPPAPMHASAAASAPTARHAYLIAWLAAALWVAGVVSWGAYEFGAGRFDLEPLRIEIGRAHV